jgi:predicted nucleic acid-binding protein
MLVDSSVWMDFLRGIASPQTRLLLESLNARDPVWLAPPILQEVLQGAHNREIFEKWDRTLGELPLLPESQPRELARAAARLYATCRWHAITPRSANDCLIALYAVRADVPLLHNDRDFPAIAKHLPGLKLLDPK